MEDEVVAFLSSLKEADVEQLGSVERLSFLLFDDVDRVVDLLIRKVLLHMRKEHPKMFLTIAVGYYDCKFMLHFTHRFFHSFSCEKDIYEVHPVH